MFTTVHVTSVLRDRVLSVPRSAVLASGERSIVFLRGRDGTLEPRQVVVGVVNEDRIEIRSGVAAGDTVVASATFLIDAESNLKAALGSMTAMPGTDASRSKGHIMPAADTVGKLPVRREE
jgi:multidrug efflux pump subunit AcrA (membrane-fusion protein)